MILLVCVNFPWSQQSWHQAGPGALRPAPFSGEKSLSVLINLCQAKKPRIQATRLHQRQLEPADSLQTLRYTSGVKKWWETMAVIIQICPQEEIENKLLLKAKGYS